MLLLYAKWYLTDILSAHSKKRQENTRVVKMRGNQDEPKKLSKCGDCVLKQH